MAHTAPKHQATTKHARLRAWVEEVAALTQPDDIHWCDGSAEEYDQLAQTLIDAGTFERLSEAKRPELLPGAVGPGRRGPGRGPDLHLLRAARPTPGRPTTGAIRPRCARC